MEDSGERRTFATGAVRDRGGDKPRPDLISPFLKERLGSWLKQGADKYSERNWERGMPFSDCIASLERHLMKFQTQGCSDEDHLAAIVFNAMAIIHFQEMIKLEKLPLELDDLCYYKIRGVENVNKA